MDDDDLATPPTHGISTGSTSGERDVAWKSSSGTEEVVAASVVFRLEHGGEIDADGNRPIQGRRAPAESTSPC